MVEVHRKLSPSSSKRWMNCAGSVALIGDESSVGGVPAMMGTAAHKVIETMILKGQHEASEYSGYWVHVKVDGDEPSELYAPDDPHALAERKGWHAFLVNEDMVFGVQVTIDETDRIIGSMFKPEVFAERFLDMSWLDPRCGGTADWTAVEPFGWAHLVDHKNGRVIVEVTDNDQLKQYAVGVAHENPDAEGVRVTISQPNAPHEEGRVRTVEFTRDELAVYEIQMKNAAEATSAPNAPRRAGDWCLRCPAKTRCPEFDAAMAAEAAADFGFDRPDGLTELEPPTTVSVSSSDVDELYRKAKWVPLFDQWASEINRAIQAHLLSGTPVGDLKLVRSKTNRKFADTVEVEKRVNAELPGFPLRNLWAEPKFKGPAQVEKLGQDKDERKIMKSLVAELSTKPPGRLVVAEANDPRPAVDVAAEAVNEFAADAAEGEDE